MISNLPNLNPAISAWSQRLEFVLIGKSQEDFKTVETYIPKTVLGVRQPLKAQDIAIKPEGQRAWKWELIHASPSLVLMVGDIIEFSEGRYKVMAKRNYSEYGYMEYEICQGFVQCD